LQTSCGSNSSASLSLQIVVQPNCPTETENYAVGKHVVHGSNSSANTEVFEPRRTAGVCGEQLKLSGQ
jgi:hypothetical protein